MRPSNPVVPKLVDAVDQIRRLAGGSRDFGQPLAVRAVPAAENQHHVRRRHQVLDGLLAILRGVTDVVLGRPRDLRVLPSQCRDDALRLVHAQSCLRQIRHLGVGRQRQPIDVGFALDKRYALRRRSPIVPPTSSCPSWPIRMMW